jgi:hypothetical protein
MSVGEGARAMSFFQKGDKKKIKFEKGVPVEEI